MKAFLLSAGLGTRLRPLTDHIPKCLLPIHGKPLLQIWLELMGKHGVSDVLVNTHWFAEKVEAFLSADYADYTEKHGLAQRRPGETTDERFHRAGKGAKGFEDFRGEEVGSRKEELGIRKEQRGERGLLPEVQLFYEEQLLGSAGTLLANREWVDDGEAFFILYGDNLTNVDLGKMWRFHNAHSLPFTLGVFKAENPRACGIAEVDEDGVVTGFVEKPEEPKSDLAAAGVYIADNRIFEAFPEDAGEKRPLDLGFHVIPNLVGQMKAYEIREFLMDIGTVESYKKAEKDFGIWKEKIGNRK